MSTYLSYIIYIIYILYIYISIPIDLSWEARYHLYKTESTEGKDFIDKNKEIKSQTKIIASQFFRKHSRTFQYRIWIFFCFCKAFLFCLKETFVHHSLLKSGQVERKLEKKNSTPLALSEPLPCTVFP